MVGAGERPRMGSARKAYHAGSWYSDQEDVLRSQLESFLASAGPGTLKEVAPGSTVRK